VSATLQVGKIDLAAEGQVAGIEFGVVTVTEVAVVVEFDLNSGAVAVVAFHGNSHADSAAVAGLHTQNLLVIQFVKNGNVNVVGQTRLYNGANVAVSHTEADFVAGERALGDVVAGRETKEELLMGKTGVEGDFWCGAQRGADVDVCRGAGDVLLEFAGDKAAVWREATGENGFAAILGEARFADLEVTAVAGVPGLFDGDAVAAKVRLQTTLDQPSAVSMVSLQHHIDAIGLGLALKLDCTKVESLAEKIGAALLKIIELCWCHFEDY